MKLCIGFGKIKNGKGGRKQVWWQRIVDPTKSYETEGGYR